MQLISNLTGLFRKKTINLETRFKKRKTWYHTLTGQVDVVADLGSNQKFGLKKVAKEKVEKVRHRFSGLKYPSEGEISSSIKHDHVLDTIEVGRTSKTEDYILSEFIDGMFLEEIMTNDGKRLRGKQLRLIRQLADAVKAIHDQGFIHRDLSLKNIVCDKNLDNLKVFNFSLCIPNTIDFRKIRNRVGTPLYMAPEIIRRRPTDHRVDIFAFGIIAYQIITLRHPWGTTENNSQSALVFDSRPPIDIQSVVPKLDRRIAESIMNCLNVDPESRFSSMKTFLMAMGIT